MSHIATIDKCDGCAKQDPSGVCKAYINPASRWRLGPCPLATHLKPLVPRQVGKKRVGQQKQRKRR